MSHLLTQPEEVEQIIMEMSWNEEASVGMSMQDGMQLNVLPLKNWHSGYVPPYRALHMMSSMRNPSFKP